MDKVLIDGLRVNAIIGVFDWERQVEQPILIDVAMWVDTRAAVLSDDLHDAVNYALVAEQITHLTQALKPQLLETLANQLAELILTQHPAVQRVQICTKKPLAVKSAQAVGIEITRERHEILARAGQ